MNACPSRKQLQQWLAGDLNEAEGQVIETHVEACRETCQPLIDSFTGFEEPYDAELSAADGSVSVPLASDPPGLAPAENPGGTAAPAVQSPAGEIAAPQPSVQSGETPALRLPGYEILGELGRGGMGVVYKARHRRMDRLVAIKVLPAGMVEDAAAVARFEREVKAAARLQHPNIVAAHDAAEADGVHFLVMEYVEGTDLAALVRHNGPLPVDRAVDCVLQAARGLAYAHRHGVVHRDIKPGNLLVDREGVVKVLDMGLARFESSLGGDPTELTGMGQIMGTVDYMAPEQALDTHRADARADIYALGITLWYFLTGRPAYMGENALSRLLAHREQPVPSLRGACPEVSPELEAIFMRMAAKRPEDRYPSMADVISAIGRVGTAHHANQPIPQASQTPAHGPAFANAVVDGDGGQCPPYVAAPAVAAPSAASAAYDPTITLVNSEIDTDPNTEQSLDISASALAPRPPRRGRKLAVGAALVGLAALALAAIVIRVQTDKGEIVVESEADDITVAIVRNGEPIKEDWQIHAGDDNRWVVRSGIVNIKLPAGLQGEFNLEQDTARLTHDGRIVVKITRKKSEVSANGHDDPNHRIASWALRHGASLVVTSASKNYLHAVTEIPSEPFRIQFLSMGKCNDVAPSELDQLRELVDLQQFQLPEAADDSWIGHLAHADGITTFGIPGGRITADGLRPLARLPALQLIGGLDAAVAFKDGVAPLAELPFLNALTELRNASREQMLALAGLSGLRMLDMNHCRDAVDAALEAEFHRINPRCRLVVDGKMKGADPGRAFAMELQRAGAVLTVFSGSPAHDVSPNAALPDELFHVWSVRFRQGQLLPIEQFHKLDQFSQLLHVHAAGTSLTDALVADLAGCRRLHTVDASHTAITDDSLSTFGSLPQLMVLMLSGTKITNRGLPKLAPLKMLETLYLDDTQIDEEGLHWLRKLPRLKTLGLYGTRITQTAVEALRRELPSCRVLFAPPPTGDPDRDAAEWVLAQGGTIAYTDASGEWADAAGGERLPSGPLRLLSIGLWGKKVRSTDLDRFVALRHLNGYLSLNQTSVDGDAIPRIVKMRGIGHLGLATTRVKSSELAGLAPLRGLAALELDAVICDDDWAGLVPVSNLRGLEFQGAVSRDDLRNLGKVKQLRAVWLKDMQQADDEAVRELQTANPLCRVLVGRAPVRAVGPDLVAELGKRLLAKKAELSIRFFPVAKVPVATETDVSSGRPFQIHSIIIPAGVSLDEDDLRLLDALDLFHWFAAAKSKNADRYAAALANQTSLRSIALWQSDLTDAGLEHLKHLPALESLDVKGTKVTAAGVEAFKKARPDCKIEWTSPVPPPSPAVDRDRAEKQQGNRAAAEWVLAKGGKVAVNQDGKHTFVERPADLPAGKLSLYTVVLYGLKQVRNEDLDRFAGLDGILDLHIANTPIGNGAVPAIARMRGLEQIKVYETRITTSAFAGLRDLPRLYFVGISADTQVDDEWAGLAQLPLLRELQVSGASSGDLRRLADIPQLRSIWLSDAAEVDAAVLAELHSKNPRCRVIVGQERARVVGDDQQRIVSQRLLQHGAKLRLGYWPDSPATEQLDSTDRPVRVYGITLPSGTTFNDEDLRLCDCLNDLGVIVAPAAVEANRVAAVLGEQASFVRDLRLPNSDLTDAGLASLTALPKLTTLDVHRTKVTSAGIEAFKKKRPDCNVKWTDPAAAAPPAADKDRAAAEWIIERGGFVCYYVPPGGSWTTAKSRDELPGAAFRVLLVHLTGDSAVISADMPRLDGLRQLEILQLAYTSIDRGALEAIAAIPSLKALELVGTQVKSSQVAPLKKLPRLHYISMHAGDQIDDDYAGLAELPQLRDLTLFAASSSDIRLIGNLKQLRAVWLRDSETDERAINEMQQANPLCRVLVGAPPQPLQPIGRDPVGELARRLHQKGAVLTVDLLPEGTVSVHVANDADLAPGKALNIRRITLPAAATLDDQEIAWLSCPYPLYQFHAARSKGADRYAAALSSQLLLESLRLTDSDLTDAGLAHLKSLRFLSELDVRGTKVTRQAVEQLQTAIPSCRIVSDFGTFGPGQPKDGK